MKKKMGECTKCITDSRNSPNGIGIHDVNHKPGPMCLADCWRMRGTYVRHVGLWRCPGCMWDMPRGLLSSRMSCRMLLRPTSWRRPLAKGFVSQVVEGRRSLGIWLLCSAHNYDHVWPHTTLKGYMWKLFNQSHVSAVVFSRDLIYLDISTFWLSGF